MNWHIALEILQWLTIGLLVWWVNNHSWGHRHRWGSRWWK
jgi:hypothetical protein